MIVPVCLVMAVIVARRKQNDAQGSTFSLKKVFPFFIAWFVAASIVNTTGILPADVSHFLGQLGKFMIIAAMAAIGLRTNLRSLLRNGLRPILLGLVCWFSVSVVSLIVQHAAGLI